MFYSFVYTIFSILSSFFSLSLSSVVGRRIRFAVEMLCACIGLYLSLIPVYEWRRWRSWIHVRKEILSIKMRKSDTFSQFMCDDRRTCLFRMHNRCGHWSLSLWQRFSTLYASMQLVFVFYMQYIGTSVQHFLINFLRSHQALCFVVSIFDLHVK